jgi:hypothetical protein
MSYGAVRSERVCHEVSVVSRQLRADGTKIAASQLGPACPLTIFNSGGYRVWSSGAGRAMPEV